MLKFDDNPILIGYTMDGIDIPDELMNNKTSIILNTDKVRVVVLINSIKDIYYNFL